mgnify:CR=1 FL=1
MRDDEYRPAMHQLVHAALYNDLGAGINAGGGFIKNHHGWIGDCRPCDGNELALPLRKIAAITGKDSIIAIRQMGDEGAPEGTLAVADKQTAGRGRRGRSWDSPSGSSIYMSLLLRPKIEPDQAPMLTLVMALSVAEGIMDCGDSCGNPDVKIKWPNDIIINGKKLVGILTEMSTQIDYINHVTIGVGINVNLTEFPEEIRETGMWTCGKESTVDRSSDETL